MVTQLENPSRLRSNPNLPKAVAERLSNANAAALRSDPEIHKDLFKTQNTNTQEEPIQPVNRIEQFYKPKGFSLADINGVLRDLNGSSDKGIVGDGRPGNSLAGDNMPTWVRVLPKLDAVANWSAFSANIANFFLQLLNIDDAAKKKITGVVDFITNLSFIPYGLDGMRKGIKKRNPFQTFGFFMEMISVWFSNLKTKYLVRGLATGTDQIWVATDTKLSDKYKDGNMLEWKNGFTDVPKASWELLKEIWRDPFGTLATIKSKGHHAVLSTTGDIIATLGFAITGKENIFGPIRDFAGALFDWELLLRDKLIQKGSGFFFILESGLDFLARFMDSNSMRIAVNSLSHACGRLALSLYKASDPN